MINLKNIYTKFIYLNFAEWISENSWVETEMSKPKDKTDDMAVMEELNLSEAEKQKLQNLNMEINDIVKEINNISNKLQHLWVTKDILEKWLENEVSPQEITEDPEAQKLMDDLYELKRQLFTLESDKKQLFRQVEVAKVNELSPDEVNTLKSIENREFLKYSPKDRLRFITKWNVTPEKLWKDWITKLDFTFTYWDTFNKELYIMTTAWQTLPATVRTVNVNWVEYSRKWINWEFFSNWKRLKIHEGTELEITQSASEEELAKMAIDLEENLKKEIEWLWEEHYELALEAKKKGYDPKFIVEAFWKELDPKSETYKQDIETKLTEISRIEDSFNSSDYAEKWTEKEGKITSEFAWYIMNSFSANTDNIKTVAKNLNLDADIMIKSKKASETFGWNIKNMEDINIEWISKEELEKVLQLKRFPPRSKEAQILFSAALQATWLPKEWFNMPELHKILESESNWRVGITNYTVPKSMSIEEFKARAVRNPNHNNPIWVKSTATWLWQLLLSNVDKYYPDWRNGINDPLNEAIGFLRYIKDRYGDPRTAFSVYNKTWYYNHPTKWRQYKWFKEWY